MRIKLKEKIKEMSKKTYINYILIIIASIAISIPLANKDLNIYRDDGVQPGTDPVQRKHKCGVLSGSALPDLFR